MTLFPFSVISIILQVNIARILLFFTRLLSCGFFFLLWSILYKISLWNIFTWGKILSVVEQLEINYWFVSPIKYNKRHFFQTGDAGRGHVFFMQCFQNVCSVQYCSHGFFLLFFEGLIWPTFRTLPHVKEFQNTQSLKEFAKTDQDKGKDLHICRKL